MDFKFLVGKYVFIYKGWNREKMHNVTLTHCTWNQEKMHKYVLEYH